MKTIHILEEFNQKIEKETKESSFILSNKQEGFAWIDSFPKSRYQGVFFQENNNIFRVIESINPNNEVKELINKFWCIERISESNHETFFIPDKHNALSYESKKESEITLDFKEAYSNDYSNYSTEKYKDYLIVTLSYRGEDFYLVIRFNGSFEEIKNNIFREYEYDKNRNSYPHQRNVFLLGKINSKKIVFYFSKNKDLALNESERIFNNLENVKNQKRERIHSLLKKIPDSRLSLAYNSCRLLLDNLNSKNGLFAGLPWFFQYWSRDELISIKALKEVDENSARDIEEKWLNALNFGWLNFPAKYKTNNQTEGLSIDAAGWLLKRLELFPDLIRKYQKDLEIFFSTLDSDLIEIKSNTWMDSLERIKPIEIQLMRLYAFKFAADLTKNNDYKEKGKVLKRKILKEFFENDLLYDSGDKKIRPNIFIAYYFYPELLNKKNWEKCFDKELEELFLSWGGVSTISKKDPLYHENYTGETPGSYHNGDSWFWVNNLAALVLTDLNKKKYSEKIKKILEASTEEILFINAIGNHAEVSSSSSLRSEGSPCQAFSAAMYIELIDKIRKTRT